MSSMKILAIVVVVILAGAAGIYMTRGDGKANNNDIENTTVADVNMTAPAETLGTEVGDNVAKQLPPVGTDKGKLAEDFTLTDMDGVSHKLSDYRGKSPVLMVFWFADCPSCREEIPELIEWHSEYGDELVILALNVSDSVKRLKNFNRDKGIEYTVLLDSKQEVTKGYSVFGVPTNILIDIDGVIQYREYSMPDLSEIKAVLTASK